MVNGSVIEGEILEQIIIEGSPALFGIGSSY